MAGEFSHSNAIQWTTHHLFDQLFDELSDLYCLSIDVAGWQQSQKLSNQIKLKIRTSVPKI